MTAVCWRLEIEASKANRRPLCPLCQFVDIGLAKELGAVDDLCRISLIPSIAAMKRPIPVHNVDVMDATHYPTRNVSDTDWNEQYLADAALDTTPCEGTRNDTADSPATAS
jgi:hypothetical protein